MVEFREERYHDTNHPVRNCPGFAAAASRRRARFCHRRDAARVQGYSVHPRGTSRNRNLPASYSPSQPFSICRSNSLAAWLIRPNLRAGRNLPSLLDV